MSAEDDLTDDDLKVIVARMLSTERAAMVRSRHAETVAAIDALRLSLLHALGQSLDGLRPDRTAQALVDRFGLSGQEAAGDRADLLSAISGGRETAWLRLSEEYLRHVGPSTAEAFPGDVGDRIVLRQQLEYLTSEWRKLDERLAGVTGIPLEEVVWSGGEAVVDWIRRVKELLHDGTTFAGTNTAELEDGEPRP